MKSKTDKIKSRLFKTGKVSRNWAIRELYFTRLGALICDLRKAGFKITTTYANEKDHTSDCVYKLEK